MLYWGSVSSVFSLSVHFKYSMPWLSSPSLIPIWTGGKIHLSSDYLLLHNKLPQNLVAWNNYSILLKISWVRNSEETWRGGCLRWQKLEWLVLKDPLPKWFLRSYVYCLVAHRLLSLLTAHHPLHLAWLAEKDCSQGSHISYMVVGSQAGVEATGWGKGYTQKSHSIIPTTFYWTKSHGAWMEKLTLYIDREGGQITLQKTTHNEKCWFNHLSKIQVPQFVMNASSFLTSQRLHGSNYQYSYKHECWALVPRNHPQE